MRIKKRQSGCKKYLRWCDFSHNATETPQTNHVNGKIHHEKNGQNWICFAWARISKAAVFNEPERSIRFEMHHKWSPIGECPMRWESAQCRERVPDAVRVPNVEKMLNAERDRSMRTTWFCSTSIENRISHTTIHFENSFSQSHKADLSLWSSYEHWE